MTRKLRVGFGAVALSVFALPACTASIPPGSEVADELIDSLTDVTAKQKECLHDKVANFTVPVAAGTQWKNIDDVADAADKGDQQAQGIIDDFFTKAFSDCKSVPEASSASSATAAG